MATYNFTELQRDELLANLFPFAHEAVGKMETFTWHPSSHASNCDTHVAHSSQALAIDFFGTLKMVDQTTRDLVMNAMAQSIGLPSTGSWTIELEWSDKKNLLQEWTPTQVDAKAESENAVILFEAKFTEGNGGACSMPLVRPAPRQCNGNYELQINPRNPAAGEHACALSGKKIRYWELVPSVFNLTSSAPQAPCPFRYSWYQWMRNLVLARVYGQEQAKKAALVIVYADHKNLPFPLVLRSADWKRFEDTVRQDGVVFAKKTYQELCLLAVASDLQRQPVLQNLAQWINAKIERVGNQWPAKSSDRALQSAEK